MPRNLFRLLEDSAACILLHKVGGGYLFAHRFLLEYFASLHHEVAHPQEQPATDAEPLVKLVDGYEVE